MSLFLLFCSLIINKIIIKTNDFLFFLYKQFLVAALSPKILATETPRALDLTPLEFYFWGAMKNKIYCSNPRAINELKKNITDYIQKIDDTVLKDVFRNTNTRATKCTEAGGGHFQHLL